jgi:hypothetical protein
MPQNLAVSRNLQEANSDVIVYTGCLMKNAPTHNFFIYYPISMSKKIKDMVFQALLDSYKMYFFWRYLQ